MMASFPVETKIKGRQLKYILRQLGRDYLPGEILNRGKQGFMFPVAYWFRNELYDFLCNYLLGSHFITEGIFQGQTVVKLLEEHQQNRVDHHVRLWMLLNLAVWHELYIAQKDKETVRAELIQHLPARQRQPL
jgi:asparagine synthase (glutamine-hydrolysing)